MILIVVKHEKLDERESKIYLFVSSDALTLLFFVLKQEKQFKTIIEFVSPHNKHISKTHCLFFNNSSILKTVIEVL